MVATYDRGEGVSVAFYLDEKAPLDDMLMAKYLIASVRKYMPKAQVIHQYSGDYRNQARAELAPLCDLLIEVPMEGSFAQRRWSANKMLPFPCLVIDTDCVLRDDVSDVFDRMGGPSLVKWSTPCIAACRDEKPGSPKIIVNGGVRFLRDDRSRAVWDYCLGHEKAALDFTSSKNGDRLEEVWNAAFQTVPHVILPETLNKLPGADGRIPASARIVHYRGKRNRFHPVLLNR